MELEAANNVQQLDFSLMALFIRATLTVKIVMVILLVSSVWSWSIIIQKFFDYSKAKEKQNISKTHFGQVNHLMNYFKDLELIQKVIVKEYLLLV